MRVALIVLIGLALAACGAGPAPSVTRGCPAPAGSDAEVAALFAWINEARAENGLRPLRPSAQLDAAAATHACDMAANAFFAHARPGAPDRRARIKASGYPLRSGNENLAFHTTFSGRLVGEMWRRSPLHWAGLLSTDNRDVGLAVAEGRGTYYWVMVAAR